MEGILNRTVPLIRPSRGLQFLARSVAAGPVLTNLVAFYLETVAGSGQVLSDSSGNGNHGQRGSTAGDDTNDFGWIAEGADFDGVDNYAALPTLLDANGQNFTVHAVVRIDAGTGAPTILGMTGSGANGWRFNALSGSPYAWNLVIGGIGTTASAASWPRGTWTDICITYDGTNAIFYKAGVAVSTKSFAGSVVTSGIAMFLGCYNNNGTPTAFGNFPTAAALLYGRALNPTEVADNYTYLQGLVAPRGITLP